LRWNGEVKKGWEEEGEETKGTFDRLLSHVIVRHSLDAVRGYCLLEDLGPILQNDAAFEGGIFLLERHALLAIPASYIDEDGGLGARVAGVLGIKWEDIELSRKQSKLRLHESVEGSTLDRIRLDPGVEAGGAVMANLKRGPRICQVRYGVIQGAEGGE
jgi:hypothetical protein